MLNGKKYLIKEVLKPKIKMALLDWLYIFLLTALFNINIIFSISLAKSKNRINFDSISTIDLVFPVVYVTFFASLTASFYFLILKKHVFAAALSSILTSTLLLLFLDLFDILKPVIGNLIKNTYLIRAAYIIVILLLVTFIWVFSKRIHNKKIMKRLKTALLFAVLSIFIFNLYSVVSYLRLTKDQRNFEPASLTSKSNSITVKPDIYYIVFDRYTNGEVLKSQLSYNNDAFINKLRLAGFFVDDNAKSN